MAGTSFNKEKVLEFSVSVGAAVVIFGAWAKILHLSFADTMLTVGLLTEAAIFLAYAFFPSPDPAKKIAKDVEAIAGRKEQNGTTLEINPANVKRLSESITKLNDSVDQIKEIADVQAATTDFTQKTKDAAAALVAVKDSYHQAASTMTHLSSAAEGTRQFHEQVNTLTKNLSSLNAIYELELQDTNNHLKAMNSFYGNLVQASQTMQGSVEDAKNAHEQITQLSKNLSNLNTVYGNMLAAMQGRG